MLLSNFADTTQKNYCNYRILGNKVGQVLNWLLWLKIKNFTFYISKKSHEAGIHFQLLQLK